MLFSGAFLFGQAPAPFPVGSPLLLPAPAAGAAESLPPQQLFEAVPELRPRVAGKPRLPRASPPISNPTPSGGGIPAGSASRSAKPRPPETPLALQRRPARNLAASDGFTLRSTSAGWALARVGVALQNHLWHTDNFSNTQRRQAIEEVIMEWQPILRIEIGSPPARLREDSSGTDYYFKILYAPTLHALLNAGTSRTLQRLTGEIGRASEVLLSAMRFDYDENIFGAQSDNSAEESSTVTELSPLIEYSLTPKTTLRAEATWRRITSGNTATDRTEHVLDTGITCAISAKTTLGFGTELGNIQFDGGQFGEQNYEQAYVSMAWQATRKTRFQTRVGVEARQFDAPAPKSDSISPVATAILNWVPNESTQINAGFRVRNQPSVSLRGATFQEIRCGADVRRELPHHFYLRGEATVSQRNYDSGTKEFEATLRPALGYRTNLSRLFDHLNWEFYWQFRQLDSNRPGGDYDRNLFGIESTLTF